MESVDDLEVPQVDAVDVVGMIETTSVADGTDDGTDDGTETAPEPDVHIDLDGIERDLADVEIALARLETGTYWTCEETGETLSDALMEANPTARRAG